MQKCPYCGEEIQNSEKKCRYCGEWINEDQKEIILHFKETKRTTPILRGFRLKRFLVFTGEQGLNHSFQK